MSTNWNTLAEEHEVAYLRETVQIITLNLPLRQKDEQQA